MYRGRLQRDLQRWQAQGILTAEQVVAALIDYDSRPSSFSVGRVLSILAAVLIGASVLLLVASNWEAIPRLARLCLILVLLMGLHGGAAFAGSRAMPRLAASLLVVAVMSFGGALALIGQMYHMSGNTQSMLLTWSLFALLAGFLYRSGAVVGTAAVIVWAYCAYGASEISGPASLQDILTAPVFASVIILLVRLTGAGRVRHLAYLLLVGWVAWLYTLAPGTFSAGLITAGGLLGFLAASLPISPLKRLADSAGIAPSFYTALLAVAGLGLIHIDINREAGAIAVGLVTLAASLLLVVLKGRDNAAVRVLGYAVFAGEVLYLSVWTIGSLLDTSALFLLSGLMVAVIAFVVIRLEKRLSHPKGEV